MPSREGEDAAGAVASSAGWTLPGGLPWPGLGRGRGQGEAGLPCPFRDRVDGGGPDRIASLPLVGVLGPADGFEGLVALAREEGDAPAPAPAA